MKWQELINKKIDMITPIEKVVNENDKSHIYLRCKCDCGEEIILGKRTIDRHKDYLSCGCHKNIIGKTFGKLTIIKMIKDNEKKQNQVFECLCECGNVVNRTRGAIYNNKDNPNFSCGCLFKKHYKDLTGCQFGDYYVEGFSHIEDNSVFWRCRCICGKPELLSTTQLHNRRILNCGCKNKNKYIDKDDYIEGYFDDGDTFYIDKEDYDKIKDYHWTKHTQGYCMVRTSNNGNVEMLFMHRLILDIKDGNIYVDHINHNVTDNRKVNLRKVTPSQNNMNRKNDSRITGVRKNANKWRAYIGLNNQDINLGTYDTKEDAIKARLEAEKKYFGEYSYNYSKELSKLNEI